MAEQIKNIDLEKYLNLEQLAQYAKGAINVVTGVFDLFVSIIVSIYILSERDEILGFFNRLSKRIFKEETYSNVEKYFYETNNVFSALYQANCWMEW